MALTFRDDQLTLPIADESGFVAWFVDRFMPEHLAKPYERFDEDSLRTRVRHGRSVALKHGFTDPVTQTQFVALMWRFGPHFYAFPCFGEITRNPKLSAKDKIDRYYECSDEAFADVMIQDENSDWFAEPNPF